jgi:C4-dicarboxylate-specific signal transduction histidine kinase
VEILTDRIGRLSRFSEPAAAEPRPLSRDEVSRLLEEIASDHASPSVRVRAQVAPELPDVPADPALLRDGLANFVVNALEAVGGGAAEIVLVAEAAALGDGTPGVRFSCADDGPGVAPELLPRLFEPAFTTKSRGSGMGLAATRRAVERRGGAVFAAPRAAGGLVVGFILPTAPPISSSS